MDIVNQLLEMLKDSLHYLRFIIVLLIVISFLKTVLTFWFDYKIKKLEHKSTYQLVVDENHRAISLTTHEKIDLGKLEKHLFTDRSLLASANKEDEKKAS